SGHNGCRVGESILGTRMSQNLSRGSDTLVLLFHKKVLDWRSAADPGEVGSWLEAKCCLQVKFMDELITGLQAVLPLDLSQQ
ncbi:MAG: hypothetical protein KZQ65_10110, partial [Candidatus Thiodiazotropha sp. (ex Gloverina cf. vestifex)]|nr:hypothetical protein [Candidatus Thiodiazotropha sp. (ex Gloverina cf. vestifex)]